MLRRGLIIFFLGLAALFIVIIQLSLLNTLPGILGQINLVLLALVFVLFFVNFDEALVLALALGLFLDIFSFAPFGFNLIILLGSAVVLNILLRNWFTNRSFYTFIALAVAAVIIFNFLAVLFTLLVSALGQGKLIFLPIYLNFWRQMLWQILSSLLSALLFFNLMSLVSRRLKPFFLAKS